MSLRKSPRLTTELLEAARANSRRSTGPRQAASKQHSKMNALKHGGYVSAANQRQALKALGADMQDNVFATPDCLDEPAPSTWVAPTSLSMSATQSAGDTPAIQGADIQGNVCATPQSAHNAPPQNAALEEASANKKYEERSGNVDENKRPELGVTSSAEVPTVGRAGIAFQAGDTPATQGADM